MFKSLLNNRLVLDNVTLFIAQIFGNALAFFYYFIAGRQLGPSDYGILGALLSILTLMAIFYYAFQSYVAKSISEIKYSKNYSLIWFFFMKRLKVFLIFSVFLSIVFILFSNIIAEYLHVNVNYLYLVSLFIISMSILALVRGVLQGLQWFRLLGLSFFMEGFVKVLLLLFLLFYGFGVFGALVSLLFANLLPFLFCYLILRRKFKSKFIEMKLNSFLDSIPFLLMLFSLTSFYVVDVFMVKHYFSSELAGYYSAMGVMGKVMLAASLSVSQVMIPRLVILTNSYRQRISLLLSSLGFVFLFVFPIIVIYFLFPEFIISLLYGEDFLFVSNLLGYYSIYMAINSLVLILGYYFIMLKRYLILFILFLFNILEVLLIYLVHSSLERVVYNLVILISILFVILFIYAMRLKNESNDSLSAIEE